MRFRAGGPALNKKDGIALVFGAGGILQGDLQLAGIVVDADVVRLARTTDAQVAQNGLVPGLALRNKRCRNLFPDFGSQTQSRVAVQFRFLLLCFLRNSYSQEFLRGSLCVV